MVTVEISSTPSCLSNSHGKRGVDEFSDASPADPSSQSTRGASDPFEDIAHEDYGSQPIYGVSSSSPHPPIRPSSASPDPAGGEVSGTPTVIGKSHVSSGVPVFSMLVFYADLYEDAQDQRKRLNNRYLALTSERENFGKGHQPDPETQILLDRMREHIRLAESAAALGLKRTTRLLPWLKTYIADTRGVGELSVGRLVGLIGDPYWHSLHDRPRRLRELYAYCGYSVIAGEAQKRKRGQKANWNNKARSACWNLAAAQLKSNGAYRGLYDETKAKHADLVATKGHAHNRALRVVSKRILRDLWEASRAHHAS